MHLDVTKPSRFGFAVNSATDADVREIAVL